MGLPSRRTQIRLNERMRIVREAARALQLRSAELAKHAMELFMRMPRKIKERRNGRVH